MKNTEPTNIPMTYERGDYSGKNWLIAEVNFGAADEDSNEPVIFHITSDHIHASEMDYGNPEADIRLWCASLDLYTALESLLKRYVALVDSGDCYAGHSETEEWVIEARKALALAKERG